MSFYFPFKYIQSIHQSLLPLFNFFNFFFYFKTIPGDTANKLISPDSYMAKKQWTFLDSDESKAEEEGGAPEEVKCLSNKSNKKGSHGSDAITG